MTEAAAQESMNQLHKLAWMLGEKNSNREADLNQTTVNDVIVKETQWDAWADFVE